MQTRRESAHTNAVDTCREEGLTAGTPAYQARYDEIYLSTLEMWIDMETGVTSKMVEHVVECRACERLPYPVKCEPCLRPAIMAGKYTAAYLHANLGDIISKHKVRDYTAGEAMVEIEKCLAAFMSENPESDVNPSGRAPFGWHVGGAR